MWTKEQQLAIDRKNSNILVSASAGSGKTAVLVERVITKVIKEKIDIDKILVVTFTNASAIELKERLLVAIYKELESNKKDSFLRRQLQYINRASITTIHAFLLEVIRSNFQVLDIDPNFKICDDAQGNILKSKAINKVLETEYIKSNDNADKEIGLYKILEIFGGKEEKLCEYILKIYGYIQSFAYPFDFLKESIEKYNIEEDVDLCETEFGREIFSDTVAELDLLLKRTQDILEKIEGNEDFVKYFQMLDDDTKQIRACIENNQNSWDIMYELLNSIEFSRAPAYKGDNIELKEEVMAFRKDILKESIKKLQKNIYAKTDDIIKDNKVAYSYIKYLYDFVEEFSNNYQYEKKRINVIDFNDIEHMALELLLKKDEKGNMIPTDIAKNIQEKFYEVYTDEYQDTSFVQEAILDAVSSGDNRFMVGDIKQSIYRFRQAMPEIFNRKYDEYSSTEIAEDDLKNVRIVLAKNFRSRENIINSINYIFEKIMSKQMGDSNYSDIETLKFGANKYIEDKDTDYKTEINIIDLKNDNEGTNDLPEDEVSKHLDELKDFEIEALYIANKIQEIVSNTKTFNVKKGTFAKTQYKDIVILLRNMKEKGNILEKVLKKYQIPVFSDASSSLFEGEEVKLVLSLLKILDNPYQDIHLISILYSIVGNFTLDELVYIRSLDRNSKVYDNLLNVQEMLNEKEELSDNEKIVIKKINDFLSIYNKLLNYSKIYSISTLLIRIYKETNIYYQYAIEKNAKIYKANLELLIELAIKYENNSLTTIGAYVSYIDNLKDKADNNTTSAKIIGENENVVRIMTIHKSKGLEFPFVILCDTMRRYNMMDLSANVTLHHKLGIGINVVNDKYKITYPSAIKQAIKKVTEKEIKSEELRMLYVALTRAKEKLIVFATIKDYEKFKSNKLIINDEHGIIDPFIILKNNTYFENIFMAVSDIEEEHEMFKINVERPYLADLTIDDVVMDNSYRKNTLSIKEKVQQIIKGNEQDKSSVIKLKDKIKNKIEYNYEYIEDINTDNRVSVSELKKKDLEELEPINIYDAKENKIDLSIQYKKPNSLNKKEERYTPVRKGTLVHFVLEHIDMKKTYSKASLNDYVDNLFKKGVLNENDIKNLNINKIYNFLNSKVGIEIRNSKKAYKEQEFILKDKKISKSTIQGVIDLFYINDKRKVVLLDFKTDRLHDEKEYIKRYEKQITIYKEAIETLMNIEVEDSYIYSFELDKEIRVF